MRRNMLTIWFASVLVATTGWTQDWPQFGGSGTRNNAVSGPQVPATWNDGKFERLTGRWINDEAKNIKWMIPLGSQTYSQPVISAGRIFIGTNNDAAYLKRYPKSIDLGCMMCFREEDGAFLWQYSAQKLASGRVNDMPMQGIVSVPLVQENRLWFVSNRGEVVCADTEGYYDQQDDGPVQGSTEIAGVDPQEADVVWTYDMMGQLDVRQHNLATCSVTSWGDTLFVGTGNGVDEAHVDLPFPQAPSFIALNKRTGELLWTDNSPGGNVLHGAWSSPAVAKLGGVPQVIFCGGDGWLYSFRADRWRDGKPELLWKFDANPKTSEWILGGRGSRNNLPATPVIYDGHVYIAVGQDPEHGEGDGHLWCIDPTKRGDVSHHLVVDAEGKIVPPGRNIATDSWRKVLEIDEEEAAALVKRMVSPTLRDRLARVGHKLPSKVLVRSNKASGAWLIEASDADPPRRYRVERNRSLQVEIQPKVIPNPNSAAVWHYERFDGNGDGKIQYEEQFHRSISSVAIKNDLLFACDIGGIVHCLNAKTGRLHWSCDLLATCWSSPLIVNDKVYVGDEDGEVAVFELSADPARSLAEARLRNRTSLYYQPLVEHYLDSSVYATPSVANGVLYIADRSRLYAIAFPTLDQ